MNIKEIRKELREGNTEDLRRRRKIIALSSLGLVDFVLISLYQTGVIKKLPDLPGKIFDSNKVNASKEAYMMGAPDGPISATAYALTMMLASAGGNNKSQRHPVFDVLLGAVVAGNAIGGAYYLFDMVARQKKVCLYCLTGAIINFSSVALAAPLARGAIRSLSQSRKPIKHQIL